MAVFSTIVPVDNTAYQDVPHVVLPFEPSSITAQVMSGSSPISVSFGDQQDAAVLLSDVLSPGSFYDWTNQRWVKNIFFKVQSGLTTIQIIAEE